MKEKGISGDVDELRRSANLPSNGRQKSKFNAFREMSQAALKDSTSGSLSKDDEQAGPQKILISYGSEKIEVDADGTVSPENVKFPPQSIIDISGIGDGTKSYGEIKVEHRIQSFAVSHRVDIIAFLERAEAYIRPSTSHYF